ncbi:MAG TPA: dTDP-4-dehydrorhamnose 3,5-epimerase [Chitinophagaceae bacterium]|nr:dTDP-4-dehydrorhamnose 3,5-epimerase [Chitinophagaceae bacterium]
MNIIETYIKGLLVIEPVINKDERGYFLESYNDQVYRDNKIGPFVQDNESYSVAGVIRGLHYQLPPHAQAKLVRVIHGRIIDVAVDIRKNSPTFGQHYSIELSGENKKQFYIPRGFAHGFSVLGDRAVLLYKCDGYYNKESEGGILYNDPGLNIDWKVAPDKRLISKKDQELPSFGNCRNTFIYES